MAYKEINEFDDLETKDAKGVFNVETEQLVFVGILGIRDIIR